MNKSQKFTSKGKMTFLKEKGQGGQNNTIQKNHLQMLQHPATEAVKNHNE